MKRTQGSIERKRQQDITPEQKQEIKEAFDIFDINKIGTIDIYELKTAMRSLGFDPTKNELMEITKEFDRNQTGRIGFPDFMEAMSKKYIERNPTELILKAFKLFDSDGSGRISLKNLKRVAKEVGENVSDDELQAMIDEFDKDQDGEINETEFLNIMKQ